MKLVFATHNINKLKEIQRLMPSYIDVLSLLDINCNEEIEETASTLEGNAKIKMNHIKTHYGYPCFADDSGLEIEALNGAPGVYSARYAGAEKNNDKNIEKVWNELKGKNTNAQFRTIIAAHIKGYDFIYEGIIKGNIIFEKRGKKGFGYDPIFIPKGYTKTFAELGNEIKNKISHRSKAVNLFLESLKKLRDK